MFAAVVFETTGAINARVLSQLARFASKRMGREFSSFCGRAWVRFSCNLQRSVSQAILNRLEGSPVVEVARLESERSEVASLGVVPRVVLEVASPVSFSLVPQVSRQIPPQIPVCPFPVSFPPSSSSHHAPPSSFSAHHTPDAPVRSLLCVLFLHFPCQHTLPHTIARTHHTHSSHMPCGEGS